MRGSASDIARQGTAVGASFTQAFQETVAVLEESIECDIPAYQKRSLAVSALTAQIGAMAVVRAVAKCNPSLSKEVLRTLRVAVTPALSTKRNKANRSRLPLSTR